jgi:hypothetical protein
VAITCSFIPGHPTFVLDAGDLFKAKIMFKIKEVERAGIKAGYVFNCPVCRVQLRFFTLPPKFCSVCERALPNIGGLLFLTKNRVDYHFGAEE